MFVSTYCCLEKKKNPPLCRSLYIFIPFIFFLFVAFGETIMLRFYFHFKYIHKQLRCDLVFFNASTSNTLNNEMIRTQKSNRHNDTDSFFFFTFFLPSRFYFIFLQSLERTTFFFLASFSRFLQFFSYPAFSFFFH